MGVLALVAAAAAVVGQDQSVLRRTGCGADDEIIARLAGGTPVTPRFAFDGACYKVTAMVEGRAMEGYLPAAAIDGLNQFESARRAARDTSITAAPAPAPTSAEARGLASGLPADHPIAAAARLLESNQPAEALTRLEGLLQLHGRHPRLLAMAGLAAYQSDDVRRALDYWKESLAKERNPFVERLIERAQREFQADGSTGRKIGTRFVLRYDESQLSSESARAILAVLEEEYSRISYELGCRTEERLTAIVQPLDAYRRTTDAAEWSSGRYDGRIRVAMLEATPGAATRRAFAHEIVHACIAGRGQFPAWLHEGLAQKLTGDKLSPSAATAISAAIKSGGMPRLDRIGQDWSRMSARHAALAYGVALRAVELFYQNYAEFGPRNLLRNPQMLPQISADLDRRLRE